MNNRNAKNKITVAHLIFTVLLTGIILIFTCSKENRLHGGKKYEK